jgi:UDP-N-acetylmuramoylalanine--D-glutamate ligase
MGVNRILVVGFGRAGESVARFYASKGYEIIIFDDNPTKDLKLKAKEVSQSFISDVSEVNKIVKTLERIVVSPGVPFYHPIFEFKNSVDLVGELEVGYENTNSKLIAVTGTNGKTTTVSMINTILKGAGFNVETAGNIGISLIERASGNYDYLVVEASSFQLYSIKNFLPFIGVFLNLTPDHLDWHKTMQNYLNAKANLFKNFTSNEIAVINSDDQVSETLVKNVKNLISFGFLSEQFKASNQSILVNGSDLLSVPKCISAAYSNVLNAAGATAVCSVLGLNAKEIQSGLEAFKPLEHRCEVFLNLNGITFINDSKSTTPASTLAALYQRENVILVMGGKNKNLDFKPIFENSEGIKSLIAIGEAKDEIITAAKNSFKNFYISSAETMKDAVEIALNIAKPGDTVMLSPACASFDWYSNYIERGNEFKKLIKEALNVKDN